MNPNKSNTVTFLNPKTCGISTNGGTRFTVNAITGRRTEVIDDELNAQVDDWLANKVVKGASQIPLKQVLEKKVLVPKYFDHSTEDAFKKLLDDKGLKPITIGELIEQGYISVRGGHGSPSSDQRIGNVPYIKVSDLRALRVNVNPTNLIPEELAKRMWGGEDSGLKAWDVLSPSRASSNIGEFCVLVPGEEKVVITKEVFIFRIEKEIEGWDPFYLIWALSLKPVSDQWDRIIFMQTNREDVGNRYLEITLPLPKNEEWAKLVSKPFRDYFTALSKAQTQFGQNLVETTKTTNFEFMANISKMMKKV